MNRFYSNGKLLLTGEYVVLDGAKALALPTKFGQSLTVETIHEPKIIWESFDKSNNIWFEDEFDLHHGEILKHVQQDKMSDRLLQILNTAKQLNPSFLNTDKGYLIKMKLDFPINWGLGTSSTLINNIANWANVNPYILLEKTFGGSGYDIACAQHDKPITFQLQENDNPKVNEINFESKFKEKLYFVYLNKKQNSREGITHYKKTISNKSQAISEISDIASKIVDCNSLNDFENLINLHEQIISKIIKEKPIKELLFKDFKGSIKSLGAWGGDFILATSTENPKSYFESKGFKIVIPYADMILNA